MGRTNKRKLKLKEYGISSKRYMELRGFCGQYPEWKQQIENYSYLSGVSYDGVSSANKEISDPTEKMAERILKLQQNVDLIDDLAKLVDPDYWQTIIDVICYDAPLIKKISDGDLPMSKSAFYERRMFFFYLLDAEKKKRENAENFE